MEMFFPDFVSKCRHMEQITSTIDELAYQENGKLVNQHGWYEYKVLIENRICYYQVSFINQAKIVICQIKTELVNLNEKGSFFIDVDENMFEFYKNQLFQKYTIEGINKITLKLTIYSWVKQLKEKREEHQKIMNNLKKSIEDCEKLERQLKNREISESDFKMKFLKLNIKNNANPETGEKLRLLLKEINELENKLSSEEVIKILEEL